MGTPIHDMTKRQHEHRWVMKPYHVETQVRKGVKSSRIQQAIACVGPAGCGASKDIEDRPAPTRRLEEEEFFEEFNPDNNEGGFYSYLAIAGLDPHYVWTITEVPGDPKDNLYAVPGIHYVNRIDYVVCTKPWTDDILEAVYMDREKNFGKSEETDG